MKEEAWGWGKGGHRLIQMGCPLLGTVPGPTRTPQQCPACLWGHRGQGEAFGWVCNPDPPSKPRAVFTPQGLKSQPSSAAPQPPGHRAGDTPSVLAPPWQEEEEQGHRVQGGCRRVEDATTTLPCTSLAHQLLR